MVHRLDEHSRKLKLSQDGISKESPTEKHSSKMYKPPKIRNESMRIQTILHVTKVAESKKLMMYSIISFGNRINISNSLLSFSSRSNSFSFLKDEPAEMGNTKPKAAPEGMAVATFWRKHEKYVFGLDAIGQRDRSTFFLRKCLSWLVLWPNRPSLCEKYGSNGLFVED